MTKKKNPLRLQVTPEQQSQVAGAFKFFNIPDEEAARLKNVCVAKIRNMICTLLDECLDWRARSGKDVKAETVATSIQERIARLRAAYTGDSGRSRYSPLGLILVGIQMELQSENHGGTYQLLGGHSRVGRYLTGEKFQESEYISGYQCVWDQGGLWATAPDQTVNGFIDFVRAKPENELLELFASEGAPSQDAIKRIISSIKNPKGNNWTDLKYFDSGMRAAMPYAHRMTHEMLRQYGVKDPSCTDIQKVADAGRFSSMMSKYAPTCDVRHYKTDEPERMTEDRLRSRLKELGLTVESGKIDRGLLSGMKPDLRVGNGSQWIQLQDMTGLVVEVKAKGKLELAPIEWVRVAQYRYEMPEDEILVLYAPKGDSGESLLNSSDAPPAVEQIKKSKKEIRGRSCFNCFDDHEQCIKFICGIFGITYKDAAAHKPVNTLKSVLHDEDDTDGWRDAMEQRINLMDQKLDMLLETQIAR